MAQPAASVVCNNGPKCVVVPPTVCPPVRHHAAATPSHFPHSAGRPAADSVPAGRRRCQDTHQHTDAHTYLHEQATAHTLTHSHKSNAWPSSLLSQHAPWLPGCCPTSNSCYLRTGLEVPLQDSAHTHKHRYTHIQKRSHIKQRQYWL